MTLFYSGSKLQHFSEINKKFYYSTILLFSFTKALDAPVM